MSSVSPPKVLKSSCTFPSTLRRVKAARSWPRSKSRAQKTRSFELRAALALAKLYPSAGRALEAHDAFAPGARGFSPTPEFPQIVEAKALFEALAQFARRFGVSSDRYPPKD